MIEKKILVLEIEEKTVWEKLPESVLVKREAYKNIS